MELKIALAILSIVSALITGILIPYIKQRIDKDKRDKIMEIAEIAVKGAEQIYGVMYPIGGHGKEKKQFVLDFIKSKGLKIDDKELDILIEATVKELNLWQEEIKGA